MNIFEKAARIKLRFQTRKGSVSVERMFEFDLKSLQSIKDKMILAKKNEEDSFLKGVNLDTLDLQIEIVDYIANSIVNKGKDPGTRQSALAGKTVL